MEIRLKPIGVQVAVVFGASSGIGRLTALEMAQRGAKVCVASRSIEGLKSLVAEIEAAGGDAFYVAADAADFEQVKAVADKCVERYGRIDTWVHAAGAFMLATVEKSEPEEYKRLIEVNLLGQIYGAKAALPHMKARGGALIHVTSVEAWRTAPYQSAYGASKHGVHGFLQVLRVELAHEEIPVVVTEILPAAINTPIYEKGRNKMPFKLRPVPPIYHPQIVADAILYAAENPTRDLIAGASGLGVVYTERLSPQLADFFSETVGFTFQNAGDKDSEEQFEDNLFAPVSGYDTVEGGFSGEQFMSDPYTYIKTTPRAKNSLLLGAAAAVGGFLAWKYLWRSKNGGDTAHPRAKFGNKKIAGLLEKADREQEHSSVSRAEKSFASETEARRVFSLVREMLLTVLDWNEYSGLSEYKIFHENGQANPSETLSVGDFIRIELHGTGKYDWVRLTDIYEAPEEFIIKVRPTYDPTEADPHKQVVSHFFTDAATNNFCLWREGRRVGVYVIGHNEFRNTTETEGAIEAIRNVAVNIGSYLGLQNAEWEKFCHGFLAQGVEKSRVAAR